MGSETHIKIRKPGGTVKTVGLHKERTGADKVFFFFFLHETMKFSMICRQKQDEIIALRHFIILKQICDWLQGGIAAGSFCRHILMIQFLRWTSSTPVTRTTVQTHWMILKLIIYESFWSKLLDLSQERFILFNPRFLAVCSVYLIRCC